MPRRQRLTAAPPAAIKMKAPKLDTGGLVLAYDWMHADSTVGFQLAFEWFATNMSALLFGDPLDAERTRSYERAVKAKMLGDHAGTCDERTHAYTTALRLYEKTWVARNLPKIDLTAQTPSRRCTDGMAVLDCLNRAYKPYDLRFGITTYKEREFVAKRILLPYAELESFIPQPPLKTVLGEALNVAKVKSLVTVEGETQLDGNQFMTLLPQILDSVYTWAADEDRKILNPVGRKVVAQRATRSTHSTSAKTSSITTARQTFALNASIRLLQTQNPFKGMRATVFNAISDGMGVAEYIKAYTQIRNGGRGGALSFLRILVDQNLVSVV